MTKQFEVGKTYATRSICDHDCIFSFTIEARTAKSVKISVHGKVKTFIVKISDGAETIKPHGSYSMCTVLRATDTSEKIEAELARSAELAAQRAETLRQQRAQNLASLLHAHPVCTTIH